MKWRKVIASSAMAMSALLAVSGCAAAGGSGGSGGQESASTDPVDITVGVLPIADTAPVFMAIKDGTFEKYGLNVKTVPAPGAAQATSGLVSGDMQFAFGSYVPFILSMQQGADLVLAANAVNPSDIFSRVVVKDSGPAKSIKDLEGKKVAVSALTSIGSVAIQESFKAAGLDPEKVTFVEMPFPNMSAALQRDQIDAAWLVEPFLTQAHDAGARDLFNPFAGAMASVPLAGYMMSGAYAKQHPEVVKNFRAALKESTQKAASDEAAVREIIPSYTKVSADLAKTIALPTYKSDIDFKALQRLADYMLSLHVTDKKFDAKEFGDGN